MATGAVAGKEPPPTPVPSPVSPEEEKKAAVAQGMLDAFGDVTEPLGSLNPANLLLAPFGITPEDVPKILMRGSWILLGAALCIIGIAMVMSGSKTAALVGSVAKEAADFVPVGKAAKIVKKVI